MQAYIISFPYRQSLSDTRSNRIFVTTEDFSPSRNRIAFVTFLPFPVSTNDLTFCIKVTKQAERAKRDFSQSVTAIGPERSGGSTINRADDCNRRGGVLTACWQDDTRGAERLVSGRHEKDRSTSGEHS